MSSFIAKVQWREGLAVADFLDSYFRARGWQIEPTTETEERLQCLGDRHFRKPGITTHLFIEYKSGIQTWYTGNVFLETISVDTRHTPGWVYTCHADYLFYAALKNSKILIFRPCDLRSAIDALKAQFKEVWTAKGQNDGYRTHGVLVPLVYAEKYLAQRVLLLAEPCEGGDRKPEAS